MSRPGPTGGDWYEAEEPTRHGLIAELQRIKRRTIVRPIPVILLALAITAGIAYKLATKPKIYEADVVLALTEGTMTTSRGGLPFDQLREYVTSVLMPDAKLLQLIEERNLHRLRRKLGPQWAINELRMQLEVEIWKNSFVYFHESEANAQKSARIGLTVLDGDPDQAFEIARDLARIVIETHDEQRRAVAQALADEVATMRKTMNQKLADLATAISVKQTALAEARTRGNVGLAAALMTDVAALAHTEKRAEEQLAAILRSPEALADEVTAAGLGTRIDLVEERRPDRQEQSGLVLAMIVIVIGTGATIGAALFVGAFDSRVHDTDDVARLGLPVLGHVPGFPGDDVGSLHDRGALRGKRTARVPSFLKWRSQR